MDQWVLFNYHNNKIEGNVLTLDDVDWLSRNDSLCAWRIDKLSEKYNDIDKHIADIKNGFKAIEYARELIDANKDKITLREIREIQNKSGFRLIPVEISGSDCLTSDIVPYLQSLLDEYYYGIDDCDKYEIISRIAKFHIKIHPFFSRTGRLLMNVQLCANIIIFSDDVMYYYDALSSVDYNKLVGLIHYSMYKTRLLLNIYNTNINLGDYVNYLR